MSAVSAPVLCVPPTGSVPDHAPEAVQVVALVEDQVSVVLPPLATMLGSELIVTVGAAVTTPTVMVVELVALPPAPVHVNTYLAVALSGPVDCEPLVANDPLQAPEAVHEVVFADFHASTADCPWVTAAGLGDKETVGLGVAPVVAAVLVGVLAAVVLTPEPHADKPAAKMTIGSKYALRIRLFRVEVNRGSIVRVCMCSMKSGVGCGYGQAIIEAIIDRIAQARQMSQTPYVANQRHRVPPHGSGLSKSVPPWWQGDSSACRII